ncbi:hypothetical protein GCM10010168_80620 [Actinoplanes ianthinogenes]|uniref:Uncharacterized protein n=1 Tax=Actinoplanes ianthinogenes TaxID=122358 RepID=A0ABM7M1Q0_9ACTN|nr:hypothetical protein [Actinoplanes ianthinogenes]BCJ45526.1 hypothetical protein Aiant_61830 [Actinoplanes ianthinogenes]GGR49634.1 hypothetical protein GCM10010168_80620 [Actinoplanes ianthinogenes]
MTNLRDQLADIAGSPGEPTPAQADADLARGRSALRRRRLTQSVAGSTFAIAAVAAAFAFVTAGSPATVPSATGTKAPATSSAFQLVDYKGEQPDAFTVDKVPAGWEVQGVTEGSLTVGPLGMADKDPSSFVDKVAVMLQSVDEHGELPGKPEKVKVGDKDGFFVKRLDAKDGVTLFVKQPNGVNLEIQVWDGIGWTRDQIVQFAEGVHVNPNAKQGRG